MPAGVVATWDDDAGYGTVRADDGAEHFFHCTQLADGTRTTSVGVRVTFAVEAGRLGRWEATRVIAIPTPTPTPTTRPAA